jgi:transposase
MAKGYRRLDRDQLFLLPPDMRQWLPAGHPVWLVIEVVSGHLDTSALHAARRTGGRGAAGFDPDMLVTLLIWAYAHQVTSSRRIEALCRTDVAFRVICAGDVPDHVTVARFRAGLGEGAGALFGEVLGLCARLGMGQLGVIALDGMKIAASASVQANRDEDRLRKLAEAMAAAHAAADAAEDDLFGEGVRGDEVPAGLADPRTRGERIAAALAGLRAEREAAAAERDAQARAYLARAAAGQPPKGAPPAAAAVAAARARHEQAAAARREQLAALEAKAAGPAVPGARRDRPRAGVEDYCLVKAAAAALAKAEARAAESAARPQQDGKDQGRPPVRNLTDPHSRLMPTRSGFIQGYNAQNVTSADGLIIATRLTADTNDAPWLGPMLADALDAAARITAARPASAPAPQHTAPDGTASPVGLLLADAGYLSESNLTLKGPDRLIATGKARDLEKAARHAASEAGSSEAANPAADDPGGVIAAMTARLATPDGITAYRQRSHIAETPHGHIKHNMRFRQLTLRGTPRATAEWTLACTAHNLFKALTAGRLTPAALTALAT